LILTGESRKESPVDYIEDCVEVLKKYFISISIEVYPLTEEEYCRLINSGVDGLVIYQEVYDKALYAKLHLSGPKKDYRYRLDAPERGAKSGMRNISLGVLLGLGEWRKEIFSLFLHAKYLQERFPEVDIGIAVPRLQPQFGGFNPLNPVSDQNIAQIISVFRILFPRAAITLSTRENPSFREDLIPLGVSRISAGSSTVVGGRTLGEIDKASQFQIQDHRNVDQIKEMLKEKGYQPVFKDWLPI
jgi:2-iminoacetate synthase